MQDTGLRLQRKPAVRFTNSLQTFLELGRNGNEKEASKNGADSSLCGTSLANPFADIPSKHRACEAVNLSSANSGKTSVSCSYILRFRRVVTAKTLS